MIANLQQRERTYSMEAIYTELNYSRQAFWKHNQKQSERLKEEEEIINQVLKWRKGHPRVGSRSLYYTMKNNGCELEIGVNKFERLLSSHGLTVGKIKSRIPKTSDGLGKGYYTNLANGMVLTDINQLIVGDITQYWLDGRWYYIFLLKDVSRKDVLGLWLARPCKLFMH